MLAWIISHGGLANLIVLFTAIKVLADLLAARLGAHRQERFVAFLQRSHEKLERSSPDSVFAESLQILSKGYERLLGPQPFALQALRRTCIFGALFLAASLAVAGLLCGKPLGMNMLPWRSYFASLEYLKILAQDPSLQKNGDLLFVAQNSSDLARFHNWPCAVIFTVYFALVVTFSTAFLVSLSTALSRLFLREMISARTTFRIFLLFLSSAVLLVALAGTASLILFILLNVWTWPLVPLFFVVSHVSLTAGFGFVSAASMGTWFFSAPWLRVVILLSVFPSILMAVVLGAALVGFPFRRRLVSLVSDQIRRGIQSPRGIFSFVSSSSAALAFVLTFLVSFLSWLARLSLTLETPTFFGIDGLNFSFLVFGAMFMLAVARAGNPESSLNVGEVIFIFLGILCMVVFGYYIQAIFECLVGIDSSTTVVSSHQPLILPAVGAVIPGSVAGCVAVYSLKSSLKWIRLATCIFIILAALDVLQGLRGFISYRDSLFSVVCDVLGAPVAALIIVKAHNILFRKVSAPHNAEVHADQSAATDVGVPPCIQ
jgi:hypothetical protein